MSVQPYYDDLREIYLSYRNDEDAKCLYFRQIVERFYKRYLYPDCADNEKLSDLQKRWDAENPHRRDVSGFAHKIRIDLNNIIHGKLHVSSKELLDFYYKAIVSIIYLISGEEPDERTMVAYGEFTEAYLDELNAQQKDIVLDNARIVYVNAGPGSGKTHLLVYKIIDVLSKMKKDARVVAMSYTRTSAASLGTKLTSVAYKFNLFRDSIPYSGTIHSFCLNCIREYKSQLGSKYDFVIADDSDIEDIVEEIFYQLDNRFERDVIRNVIENKDKIKRGEEISVKYDPEIVEAIINCQQIYNRITVGEILSTFLEEISTNDDFVKWVSDRMNFLMVDEAQDLTAENYQILDVLLQKMPNLNLFLVGDPRQNIFEFLGGSYKHLEAFLNKYSDQISRKFLSISYRCPQQILDYTNSMKFSDCENIVLESNSSVEGKLYLESYNSEEDEAVAVLDYIKSKNSLRDVAILSPRLRPLRKIVDMLNSEGISFVVKGGSNAIKPHIQAFNCMNKFIETQGRALGAANNLCEKLEIPTCKTLQMFKNTNVGSQLCSLQQKYSSGNISYLELNRAFVRLCRQYIPNGDKVEQDNDFKKLNDFVLTQSKSPKQFSKAFLHHRRKFEVQELEYISTGTTPEAVTISTIHSSKGLEWPYVILPGMSDNHFPNKKILDSIDPSEKIDQHNSEMKLLFVGATRALQELRVSYSTLCNASITKASPLLGDIDLYTT